MSKRVRSFRSKDKKAKTKKESDDDDDDDDNVPLAALDKKTSPVAPAKISRTDKLKYNCNLCPAKRASQVELDKHALIHDGEFRCDTCYRGFPSAEKLSSHIDTHNITGKPYACFVCSVGYRSLQKLNRHFSVVHRDEDKPKIAPQHLCSLCGQVFHQKDKLNRHLKDNHIVLVIGEIHPIDEPNIS